MPDEMKAVRRRRRPQPAQQMEEESPVSAQPMRIIVGEENDEPDWMVSAGNITGAASRRTRQKGEETGSSRAWTVTEAKAHKESQAVLKLKKKPAESDGSSRDSMREGETQGTAKKTQSTRTAVKRTPSAKRTTTVKRTPKRTPAKRKKLTKKERERRKKVFKRTALLSLGAVLAVVILAVGIIGGSRLLDIKKTLDVGNGVFYPNIFVNNIPLAGRTLDEAATIVTQQVTAQIASFKITLRTQDGRSWDITGSDLQMQYDVADQLDQLWAIGHTGSSAERYKQVKALEEEPAIRYTTLSYDLSRVNQILTQIKAEIDTPAVSATRIDDSTQWPPFSYTDDVPGQTLDITGLNEKICDMVDRLESGVVDLSPTPVEATVTREMLEGQIVKLSSFNTTISKAGNYAESKKENIRIGTEKFNHLIIKSGESVSFNKVTGQRTAANGYQVSTARAMAAVSARCLRRCIMQWSMRGWRSPSARRMPSPRLMWTRGLMPPFLTTGMTSCSRTPRVRISTWRPVCTRITTTTGTRISPSMAGRTPTATPTSSSLRSRRRFLCLILSTVRIPTASTSSTTTRRTRAAKDARAMWWTCTWSRWMPTAWRFRASSRIRIRTRPARR